MKFSLLLFVFVIGFAGTNTLPLITETIRTKAPMENLRQALIGDIVPRDSAGVACSGCASLGTDDFKWRGIFINPEDSEGGLRRYAGYAKIEYKRQISSTFSTASFAGRSLIPSTGTISNTLGRPLYISFSCLHSATSELRNASEAIAWIRLGRKVGTTETILQTWAYAPRIAFDVPTVGNLHPDFAFTNDVNQMNYLDVSSPSTEFNYFIEGAACAFGACTAATVNLEACVHVVSL